MAVLVSSENGFFVCAYKDAQKNESARKEKAAADGFLAGVSLVKGLDMPCRLS
ncbi:MAG: hypothetical protein JHC61_17005 [Burkholderiaceae bacterium]|nr:hypothetical protein [Burkholderiaceae bacterium]